MNKVQTAIQKAREHTKDREVLDLMERFEWCYRESKGDLERMQEFQNMYDNVVNTGMWPTTTQLPIPFLFTSVHEALPATMDYLFPRTKWINLLPQDDTVDAERTERVEWALQIMLLNRMRLPWSCYSSIHDCFKVGVGYGAIEPCLVTPPAVFNVAAFAGEKKVREAKVLKPGRPKMSLRYVPVGPGEIITSKDGVEFNGHRRVSHAFRFTTYSEHEFKRMFKGSGDSEAAKLKGDVEAIIAEARSLGFTSNTSIVQDMKKLAGIDIQKAQATQDERIPVRVPVLKAYLENRHVWIANGTQIIFDEGDKYLTMTTPLIKWSAWPDGDRWYPMSAIEAAQKQAIGLNLWVNVMFDVLLENARPTMLYNKQALAGGKPERGPNGDIGVTGDVRVAASYLQRPTMDQGMFAMGDVMQKWYGNTTGRQIGEIAPGLLRAGANAFEGVLQTTKGRERLANAILEMGALEDVVKQTLIHMQVMGQEEKFSVKDWDETSGKEYVKRVTITPDDLTAVYDLQLDLSDKHRLSSVDYNQRIAMYQAKAQSPYVDQYENLRELYADDYRFRRSVPSRAKVREMQEQERQAKLQAQQQGAGSGLPPGTQMEAGAAGVKENA